MIGEPGIVFPEFKDASTWRSNSFAVLQNEIKKQVVGYYNIPAPIYFVFYFVEDSRGWNAH